MLLWYPRGLFTCSGVFAFQCTKSNLEQGAVDTELLLGYGEMQRDCIIGGGRITQKWDDPKKDAWCVSGGGEGGYRLLEPNWHAGYDNLICRDSCFCVLKKNLKRRWQEAYPQRERALASPSLPLWSWSHVTPKKRSQTAWTPRSAATSKNIQHHLGSCIRLVYGATHRPPENPPRSEPSRWSWCDPPAKCNHVGLGTGVDAGRGWGPSTSGSIYLH